MVLVDIRDTIEGTVTTDANGYAYFTRRINLPENKRFDIQAIDIFDDNGSLPLEAGGSPAAGQQVFVSPYPMQRDGNDWGVANTLFPNGGGLAGDEHVLYKELSITTLTQNNQQQFDKVWTVRFPNDDIAARPTFTFFTPHVYVTVMIWNSPNTPFLIRKSMYMKVDVKNTNNTSFSMGVYKEFLDSQVRLISDMGYMVDPTKISGNTFPMWKYGGIRPELMLSGTTALRYYNKVASNASQEMVTQASLQTAFRAATNMVAFDAAFGDEAANLPEWITLLDVEGVTSGLIRPYPPPLKFADNGNTLMF